MEVSEDQEVTMEAFMDDESVCCVAKVRAQKDQGFSRVMTRPAGRAIRCLDSRGLRRVGSGGFTGRFWAVQDILKPNGLGHSGPNHSYPTQPDPTRPDPTRPDPTRER